MSNGTYDETHDYTQGDSIPESALNADDLVIGGSGAIDHDPDKTEAENSFRDLAPGVYLLNVVGFGKAELKSFDAYVNGQPVSYSAYSLEVRFADSSDPTGRIRNFFRLPPENDQELFYYNHGTNASGKSEGFMSKVFDHFIDRLLPGKAYVTDAKGRKVLSPFARTLANWKGAKIWAEVAEEKSSGVNPSTGEPYPPRCQIKLFSFRPFVEGAPSPYPTKVATNGKPSNIFAGAAARQAAKVAHNPQAAMANSGVDAI